MTLAIILLLLLKVTVAEPSSGATTEEVQTAAPTTAAPTSADPTTADSSTSVAGMHN